MMNFSNCSPDGVSAAIQSGDIVCIERKGKYVRVVTDTQVFSIYTPQARQIACLLAGKKFQQVHKNYWVSFHRIVSLNLQNRYLLLHRSFADQSEPLLIPFDTSFVSRYIDRSLMKGARRGTSRLVLDLLLNPRFN